VPSKESAKAAREHGAGAARPLEHRGYLYPWELRQRRVEQRSRSGQDLAFVLRLLSFLPLSPHLTLCLFHEIGDDISHFGLIIIRVEPTQSPFDRGSQLNAEGPRGIPGQLVRGPLLPPLEPDASDVVGGRIR
jgi:hypothetical protein